MSEVTSRLYESAASAQAAADALREAGYRARELTVLSPPATRDEAYAAARAAGVFKGRAAALADGVAGGNSAVICRTRFADGVLTREIMDAHTPVGGSDSSSGWGSSEGEAAPLSDMLGLRVLGGKGDFFSDLFGLPALTRNQRGKASLSNTRGPYKPVIPFPLLSASQRGKAKLLDNRGDYKPIIPMPTLSRSDRGGYKPVIPMPTLLRSDRDGYAPIVPAPLLTDQQD